MDRKRDGYFRDNGLDVDLVYIGGGPRSMAALLSGQLQIIGTGGNALVAANLNGAKDTVLIATTYNTLVFSLMTSANLKDPKRAQRQDFRRHGDWQSFGFHPAELCSPLVARSRRATWSCAQWAVIRKY